MRKKNITQNKIHSSPTRSREENLFYSLCDDSFSHISANSLKETLMSSGLQPDDYRLKELFHELNNHDQLSIQMFTKIIQKSELFVEKALRGELAIPDFKDFSTRVDQIYDDVKSKINGELASYIPPLAEVDPDQFGIAIITKDGQVYKKGQADVDFSIQSMCKPFNYCIAIEQLGIEEVHKHVGQEPSGRFFDDLSLLKQEKDAGVDDNSSNVPFNPMINAGAIMTAGLIKDQLRDNERLNFVREQFGKLIGWKQDGSSNIDLPRFNKEMARQENFKGYNNLALGYLLMATGNLPHKKSICPDDIYPEKPDEFEFYIENAVIKALKLYFSICSIEMKATDVAMAAATLANGGVCPVTQERVLSQETVRKCLPVIQMCGMYNGSGKFFQEIGLPAKSGVGGGVFLVVPQLMGICIFSPRLDPHGNSVRGIAMAQKLTSKYLLHLFDGLMTSTERLDPRVPISRWRASSCSESIWASSIGDIRTLQRLLSEQRDLEAGDYDGRTPLHLAAAEGHTEIVKFLLDNNVKPRPDRWGGYPIADAMVGKHQDIINLLKEIKTGLSLPVHITNKDDQKVDNSVKIEDELSVIELLWAASENNIRGIRQLVARGVPVHASDYDDRTALHLAAAEGHIETVKYLITRGHPLHVRDRWNATPLDEARREKRSKVSAYLSSVHKKSN